MQNPQTQNLSTLQDIESRDGVRGAVRYIHRFLYDFINRDHNFKSQVVSELKFVYGEFDYTPASIANGTNALISVTVADAIPGYCVEASYDKDLQGLFMGVPYVSAIGTVKIPLFNNTGGPITLTAGRFRVYAWPRTLSI